MFCFVGRDFWELRQGKLFKNGYEQLDFPTVVRMTSCGDNFVFYSHDHHPHMVTPHGIFPIEYSITHITNAGILSTRRGYIIPTLLYPWDGGYPPIPLGGCLFASDTYAYLSHQPPRRVNWITEEESKGYKHAEDITCSGNGWLIIDNKLLIDEETSRFLRVLSPDGLYSIQHGVIVCATGWEPKPRWQDGVLVTFNGHVSKTGRLADRDETGKITFYTVRFPALILAQQLPLPRDACREVLKCLVLSATSI